MSDSKNLKVGIIGTGFGIMIAKVFKAIEPKCSIYLSGSDKRKTLSIVDELKLDGAYGLWQDLVKDPKIDLIVIATPSYLHKEMFELSVANKKNIVIEKPAALTSSDVEKMEGLIKIYPKIIVVNHEARFNPIIHYLKELILSGNLGSIQTVRMGAYLNLFTSPEYEGSWYNQKVKGGGQLNAIGIHQIDLARFILGMPKILDGSIQTNVFADPRFILKVDAETQFSGHFICENGTSIQMFNDTYCFGYKDFQIDIIGSKGIVLYSDILGLRESYGNHKPLKNVFVNDPLSVIHIGNSLLTRSLKYFIKAIVNSINNKKFNQDYCTLGQEKENIIYLEKFRDV